MNLSEIDIAFGGFIALAIVVALAVIYSAIEKGDKDADDSF